MRRWLARLLLRAAYRLDPAEAENMAQYWLNVKRLRELYQQALANCSRSFVAAFEGLLSVLAGTDRWA